METANGRRNDNGELVDAKSIMKVEEQKRSGNTNSDQDIEYEADKSHG